MPFTVRQYTQPGITGLDARMVALEDGAGNRADVWPALGFNCFRWQAPHKNQVLDLLYADPQLFANGRPTRSGIPVLFPFPNRIRGGRFTWEGKEFDLPKTEASGIHAIHGFVCRRPWRVVGQGADAGGAWVTGEFQCSRDDPASRPHWPADHILRLTVRLRPGRLRLEAEVENPDKVSLPFGLGFHQYFRTPLTPHGKPEQCQVTVPARAYWVLDACLPTGERLPVTGGRDLTQPRFCTELQLDDVLTTLGDVTLPDGLRWNGTLAQRDGQVELRMNSSPAFQEMVVFTPPHRQAFCIEPYTCTTDAINLQPRTPDAGLLVLAPGQKWKGIVEMAVQESKAEATQS
jgi:aldose 1-epimerase